MTEINAYSDDALKLGEGPISIERSAAWKDGRKVLATRDDMITVIGVRPSGIVDYAILGASVSWRGLRWGKEREFLCHTHVVNVCAHTGWIERYRREHSE